MFGNRQSIVEVPGKAFGPLVMRVPSLELMRNKTAKAQYPQVATKVMQQEFSAFVQMTAAAWYNQAEMYFLPQLPEKLRSTDRIAEMASALGWGCALYEAFHAGGRIGKGQCIAGVLVAAYPLFGQLGNGNSEAERALAQWLAWVGFTSMVHQQSDDERRLFLEACASHAGELTNL